MPLRKLVAGNWKMNGLAASAAMLDELAAAHPAPGCDVLICPPATLIARLAGGPFPIGGQDCHWEASGAHTGDISAEMLADAGAVAVIVGHSERRADHGETDAIVARKAAAAWRAGLLAIVCVGETEAERDAGRTLDRVGAQLAGSVPDGADRRAAGRRLRAGLGDRHRAHPIPERNRAKCMISFATACRSRFGAGDRRRRSACSTAARSSPATPRRSSPSPTSTARWSAAPR